MKRIVLKMAAVSLTLGMSVTAMAATTMPGATHMNLSQSAAAEAGSSLYWLKAIYSQVYYMAATAKKGWETISKDINTQSQTLDRVYANPDQTSQADIEKLFSLGDVNVDKEGQAYYTHLNDYAQATQSARGEGEGIYNDVLNKLFCSGGASCFDKGLRSTNILPYANTFKTQADPVKATTKYLKALLGKSSKNTDDPINAELSQQAANAMVTQILTDIYAQNNPNSTYQTKYAAISKLLSGMNSSNLLIYLSKQGNQLQLIKMLVGLQVFETMIGHSQLEESQGRNAMAAASLAQQAAMQNLLSNILTQLKQNHAELVALKKEVKGNR